jgi:ATP-dependent helicase/nuclease subunit A
VVAHVRSALASDIVQLAARGSAWREAYVATTVGELVVEGYIDLLVRTPEGLVVVDYKTDGVRSVAEAAARVEHYRLQGATYALVLEASTGQPVIDVRFLFTGASGPDGGAIELALPGLRSAIDDVRTRLMATRV